MSCDRRWRMDALVGIPAIANKKPDFSVGIKCFKTHTLVREVYQVKPEAGVLAPGTTGPTTFPAQYWGRWLCNIQMIEALPVTVAGPRRIPTGFPFEPR